MTVRLLTLAGDEADRLAFIDYAAFPDRLNPWSANDFRTMSCQVIADETVEKGYVAVQIAADQAEIVNLAVVPNYRRNGLGAELLNAVEDLAVERGATSLFLEVAIDNLAALALYQGRGYTEEGRRMGYFLRKDGRRIDALILTKRMSGKIGTPTNPSPA